MKFTLEVYSDYEYDYSEGPDRAVVEINTEDAMQIKRLMAIVCMNSSPPHDGYAHFGIPTSDLEIFKVTAWDDSPSWHQLTNEILGEECIMEAGLIEVYDTEFRYKAQLKHANCIYHTENLTLADLNDVILSEKGEMR